jgi:hypothetical protein
MLKRHFAKMEAMRRAAEQLFARPLVGRDVFMRFRPWEDGELVTIRHQTPRAILFDLVDAYAQVTRRFNERSSVTA